MNSCGFFWNFFTSHHRRLYDINLDLNLQPSIMSNTHALCDMICHRGSKQCWRLLWRRKSAHTRQSKLYLYLFCRHNYDQRCNVAHFSCIVESSRCDNDQPSLDFDLRIISPSVLMSKVNDLSWPLKLTVTWNVMLWRGMYWFEIQSIEIFHIGNGYNDTVVSMISNIRKSFYMYYIEYEVTEYLPVPSWMICVVL